MMPAGASAADPARWLDGADIDRSAVLFVIGLGDGGLLTALARRGWRGKVVALEPSGTSSQTPSPDLTILRGPDYQGLDDVVRAFEPDCEQPVVVGDPAVLRASRDEAVRVSRLVVRAWFGARANQEARRKYAGPYLLNTLRNLPTIAAEGDAATLVRLFPGRPALLVAAGPSLDANLPAIAAHRDRVVLIAVDTALRPLLAAGLAPDLVVALDPSDVNASHLVDLPLCPRTWLVAEGSLDSGAFRHFAGRTHVHTIVAGDGVELLEETDRCFATRLGAVHNDLIVHVTHLHIAHHALRGLHELGRRTALDIIDGKVFVGGEREERKQK